MINFTQLRASNFGPFADLTVPLSRRGLVLVKGDNRDTAAAESNGSGKSTIFKALSWCLFGDTVEGDKHDSIIRIGERSALVLVAWEDGDSKWSVGRAKERGCAVQLRLHHNGADVSGATTQVTQSEVIRRLGLDFHAWRNTVLYGQGDLVRFADPDTTDSDRKLILKRILRLEVLDRALALARARAADIASKHSAATDAISKLEAELRGMGNTDELEQHAAELEDEAKRLLKLSKRSAPIKKLLSQIQEHIDGMAATRKELQAVQAQISEHRTANRQAQSESNFHLRDIGRLSDQIDELKGGDCPTCGSPANSPHAKQRIAALVASLADLRKQEAEATARSKAAVLSEQELNGRILELNEQLSGVGEWQRKSGELKAELRQAEEAANKAQSITGRANKVRASIAEITDKRYQLETQQSEAAKKAEELEVQRQTVDFWARGFSNAGLPSFLMDSVIPALTERANHYLETLSDGDIRVGFDTQSKLKTGELREKLAIHWTIEGIKGATPSGGQRKKISIAVDLALMDLVSARERAAIDLLMLDEILDGLDSVGKTRVMELLNELRTRRNTILVVSHDPGLAELFESVITVVKEGGEARLEE